MRQWTLSVNGQGRPRARLPTMQGRPYNEPHGVRDAFIRPTMLDAPFRERLLRQPHLLLFPLGALLAAVGVLPWIFFVLGLSDLYRPIFHSVGFRSMFHPLAEIEGFLGCFAVGAVLTIVPRRTSSAPPSSWQLALAVAAPIAIVISAAVQKWWLGQAAWLALMGMVIEFIVRRRRAPGDSRRMRWSSFWVALSLCAGAAGTLLAIIGESREDLLWVHEIGRALLTQGLFSGLALGTAESLLGEKPATGRALARRSRWIDAALALGSVLFFASFGTGLLRSPSIGFAMRAVITLAVVLYLVRVSPLAEAPGSRGRAARIALWMLPLGNAWAALMPTARRAGMHVIYLACFAMLILVISTLLYRRAHIARQLVLGWGCLTVALGARTLVEMDPPNFRIWLGIACLYFALGLFFAFGRLAGRLVSLLPEGGAQSAPNGRHR